MQNEYRKQSIHFLDSHEKTTKVADSIVGLIARIAENLKSPRQLKHFFQVLTLSILLLQSTAAYAQSETNTALGVDTAIVPERIEGTYPWIYLLCVYEGDEDRVFSIPDYEELARQLDLYWQEVSDGEFNQAGSDVAGPYVLPDMYTRYEDDTFHMCTDAADEEVDFSKYEGITLLFNSELSAAGLGGTFYAELDGVAKNWRTTWLSYKTHNVGVVAHEQGHSFGLKHSAGPTGDTYNNPFDNMANPYGQGLNGNNLLQLGWAEEKVVSPGEVLTIDLDPLSAITSTVVTIPSGAMTHTVEARVHQGLDENIPFSTEDGVVIHEVAPVTSERRNAARLISEDGNAYEAGAVWEPGEKWQLQTEDGAIVVCVDGEVDNKYRVTISNNSTEEVFVCPEKLQQELFTYLPQLSAR